jgi:hypothetical protein
MDAETHNELKRILAKRRFVNEWLEADLIKFIDELLEKKIQEENK